MFSGKNRYFGSQRRVSRLIRVGAYTLVFLDHEPYTGREAEFLQALDAVPER